MPERKEAPLPMKIQPGFALRKANPAAEKVVTMSISSLPKRAPDPTGARAPSNSGLFRRRGGSRRPLWLLWPGLFLLLVVIGLPFLMAFYISFLNLDQYSLRSWLQAP